MPEQRCIIAYDHNDDLDECAVCGWQPDSVELAASDGDVVKKINMLNAWMQDNCHKEET